MRPDDFIIAHLIDPSERWWGRLISLTAAGVTMRGIDVRQIEAFRYQFKRESHIVHAQSFFFPMRRVQKLDLDEPIDTVPSVIQSIMDSSGLDLDVIIPKA